MMAGVERCGERRDSGADFRPHSGSVQPGLGEQDLLTAIPDTLAFQTVNLPNITLVALLWPFALRSLFIAWNGRAKHLIVWPRLE
jgi:hypothetical protein